MLTLKILEERLEQHLLTVDELIDFDRSILDYCIMHIDGLNERLKKGPFQISNPTFLAENTLKAVKNVRENDSLRFHYLSMYNSCVVLQVSYFTSIIDDIFKHTCKNLSLSENNPNLSLESLKQKNDINFQNMFSVIKTYKNYLNIDINKDSICNTIILAISSRHAIVHSLGRADDKFLTQVNNAVPRDIKPKFGFNEKIQFSPSELQFVKFAMLQFVSSLCDQIRSTYSIA